MFRPTATSILNFIADRFDLPPLGQCQREANGFEDAFRFDGVARERPAFSLASIPDAPVGTALQNRLTLSFYLGALGLVAVGLAVVAKLRRI